MAGINFLQTLSGNPDATPDAIAAQRAYAKALMEDNSPIASIPQGINAALEGLMGGLLARKANASDAASAAAAKAAQEQAGSQNADMIQALLGQAGQQASPAMPAAAAPQPAPDTSPIPSWMPSKMPAVPAPQAAMPAQAAPPSMAPAAPGMNAGIPQVPKDQLHAFLANPLIPDAAKNAVIARLTPDKPNVTDVMANYQAATQGGFNGSFYDYQLAMAKAGASSVNIGANGAPLPAPPTGFAYRSGPDGKAVIGDDGGPELVKIRGGPAAEAAGKASAAAATSGNIVTEDIDRALAKIGAKPGITTGFVGNLLTNLPGSAASDTAELIGTIKANSSMDKLNQMRQQSPTGGALGSVTEGEEKLLADTLGSLDQVQSSPQLIYNLRRVKNIYLDIVNGKGVGPREDLATPMPPPPNAMPQAAAPPAAPASGGVTHVWTPDGGLVPAR